jgi:hypothetical protein
LATDREIIFEIKVNGRKITSKSKSPVHKLEITVATKDGNGREELQLGFGLNVTQGQGQPNIEVPGPQG